jgi:hypothetical protein
MGNVEEMGETVDGQARHTTHTGTNPAGRPLAGFVLLLKADKGVLAAQTIAR